MHLETKIMHEIASGAVTSFLKESVLYTLNFINICVDECTNLEYLDTIKRTFVSRFEHCFKNYSFHKDRKIIIFGLSNEKFLWGRIL